ncbi:MAG TPA: ABC transporter substrate-binding protein [Xanthobacteraceae bacterium]|jgi:putative ABC transport system substrate-binding protein
MHRREFIGLLGGAAACPLAARAQQPESMPRIGFLTGLSDEDPEAKARLTAFRKGLAGRGWTVGRNVQMDYRAAGRDPDRYRKYAEDLVALRPDVLVAGGTPALEALQQVARRVPIVFANATDPAGDGYLARFARPGRNTTGVLNFESRFAWKWLELLKEIAPRITRVAIVHSTTSTALRQMNVLQAQAPRFGVQLTALSDRDAGEIERGITAFAYGPGDGLIVTSQLERSDREQIIALVALARVPAVYPFRRYVEEGGLISYGTDQAEPYRKAADYVDRILNGEWAIDLPVQPTVNYHTVLNMKSAKALGLELPPQVLARVNEVIE